MEAASIAPEQRSNVTSYFSKSNSVTSIDYAAMLFWPLNTNYHPLTRVLRHSFLRIFLLQVSHSVESALRAADRWGPRDPDCAARGTPSREVLVVPRPPVQLPRHGQTGRDVQRHH